MTDEKIGRHAYVEWAADIRPERQVWLWENRIPVGTVSALAGRGGTGKTTYGLHMAARLSRGTLPGQYFGDPRPTLLWSGEDAWGPVLVPRLIAAGADMGMIGRLAITSTDIGGEVTPALPVDINPFRDAITHTGAALVMIDPIASTMAGDLHREADVRSAIDALARLAADTGAVVMFVRHFGEGGGNPSDKMSGSHAFRDAVRSVFLFAEDGDRVVVTQDKGNYAPKGDESFAFHLESVSVPTEGGPAAVARVVELGASDISVGDVINRSGEDDDPSERTAAEAWLTDYLMKEGPTPAKVVKAEAGKERISERTLKRAKKDIGVQDHAHGFPRTTTWYLPSQATLVGDAQDTQNRGPTGPTGADLPKRDGPTAGPTDGKAQSGQPSECGPTVPISGVPTPLTARREGLRTRRTVRFKGQELPRCIHCEKPVLAGQGETHLSCASKQEVTA